MAHVAVVGTGRTGGQVAFSLAFERCVTELSLVDIAPKVAEMVKEELHHALASHGFDLKINAYDNSKALKNAEFIVVAAVRRLGRNPRAAFWANSDRFAHSAVS